MVASRKQYMGAVSFQRGKKGHISHKCSEDFASTLNKIQKCQQGSTVSFSSFLS